MKRIQLKNTQILYHFYCLAFSDELVKLSEEGYGRYVDKEQMAQDKVLPTRNCFCAFVKRDIRALDESFFHIVKDKDCTQDLYIMNYDKPIDDAMKKVSMRYSLDKDILLISPLQEDSTSKCLIF